MGIEIDCSDIIDIFKTHLKVENSVKSIAHTFLNERYTSRINYAPYFQRKYVWDAEKATYFIESILLGTEIPPIVLFDGSEKNEVIDGRQRYETIKRFLENALALSQKGLKALTYLSGKHYVELPDEIKENFKNTKIRILQFSIVNEPAITPEQEDKVKKEIFTRYNSGIIALKPQEIERAAYINDTMVHSFKELLESDNSLLNKCQVLFMPPRKQKMKSRDKINYILTRTRTVLSMKHIPIQSYAAASSKSDVIRNYFLLKVESEPVNIIISTYKRIINKMYDIRCEFAKLKSNITENTLFFECLFWGLSIVLDNSPDVFDKLNVSSIANEVMMCQNNPIFWSNISVEKNEFDMIFFATGSHYYMSILNRYTFISNYFHHMTNIDFSKHIKDKISFEKIMNTNVDINQYKEFTLSKTDPVSATVYDILNDVKTSNFIIRPDYQRSEAPNNIQKASYLLESIMLGIRIPPIFVYRRNDHVSEVIDGQQRLLSILGFLRKPYKDMYGNEQLSDKNGFKLSKLRFLKDLNNKDIDGIDAIDPKFHDRILDFQIDIVEINQSLNPNFSPIDLFLRLNTKPFPIEPNTFEMWNAYVTKEYVEKIKMISKKYSKDLFHPLDTRMKNEELITMLAFLSYIEKKKFIKPGKYLNIFVRNQRINARFSEKGNITATLGEISKTNDQMFCEAINDVESFINKLQILCGEHFEKFSEMLSHTKKQTQSKTNQNFYLLWIAVAHIDLDTLKQNKELIFYKIKKSFSNSQEIKNDAFDVTSYIDTLSSI